jgi:hypothetical protein
LFVSPCTIEVHKEKRKTMHMSDAALRAAVEKRRKQLKRPDEGRVSDEAWAVLHELNYVEDARTKEYDVDGIEFLGRKIDWFADAFGSGVPGSGGGRMRRDESYDDAEHYGERSEVDEQTVSIDLSDYEYERSRAYAEVMARLLNQADEVIDFRRDYLNGKVFAPEQAYTFIESSAARYLPPELFKQWGIPVRGHETEVLAESYSDPLAAEIDYSVTLRVLPPGVTKTVRYAPSNTPAPYDRKVDWRYFTRHESHGPDGSSESVVPLRALSYRGADGLKKRTNVWPGSVLDNLRHKSIRLAALLPISYEWTEEDMVWHFLTGSVPEPRALTMKILFGGGARIDMAIAPWISVETIEKNYRIAQRQILIKSNHASSLRRLAVLRFVEAATRAEGKRPPFPQLLSQWNAQHPAWRYKDYRGLAQAYRQTLKQVAHSPLRIPNL